MKKFRELTVNSILKSPNEAGIKMVIESALLKLKDHGSHPFIIQRFTEKLKQNLIEIPKINSSNLEQKNILEALVLLNKAEINSKNGRLRVSWSVKPKK